MTEPQPDDRARMALSLADLTPVALVAAWQIHQALTRADIWREVSSALERLTGLTVVCFEADGRELLSPVPDFANERTDAKTIGAIIDTVESAWFERRKPAMLALEHPPALAVACTDADGVRGAIALIGRELQPPSREDAYALALVALAAGQALGVLALEAKTVPLIRHEAEMERLRTELSHTLHDGPAQDFAMANMALEHLLTSSRLRDDPSVDSQLALDYVGRAVQSLRHFIAQLREGVPLNQRESEAIPSPSPVFPDTAQEEAALAIVREALRNTRKHANAERITITIERNQQGIDFLITDDGEGFSGEARPGHFGLAHMREAATAAGGDVSIESQPGRGTAVRFTAPRHARPARERSTRRNAPAKLETGTDDDQ